MKIFTLGFRFCFWIRLLAVVSAQQQLDRSADRPNDDKKQLENASVDERTPLTTASKFKTESEPFPTGMLRLSFNGVPLESVLDYLSEAAGFIIVNETDMKGNISLSSIQPVTKDEAVELLNTVLNKNGYAALRNGRTLTIVSRAVALKRNIPVKKGGDAVSIPRNNQMVTQIIPVRHLNVTQLTTNLRPLMREDANMSANDSANALILTATQADIRHLTEIINALDESISKISSIKVFPLRYADATDLATVIKELFAPSSQQGSNNSNNRSQFSGGPGGFDPGSSGGNEASGGNAGQSGGGENGGGNVVNARVVVVADEHGNSLVVAATEDMMRMIQRLIKQIDQSVSDSRELQVFHLINADPVEMADTLAALFPDDTKTGENDNQPIRFVSGPIEGASLSGNTQLGDGERIKKKVRVLTVPDPRTASIIVSAASGLMQQIGGIIASLDSNPARKQKLFVYAPRTGNVRNMAQILNGMFQSQNSRNNQNNSSQNDALMNRMNQNQQSSSGGTTTGLGGGNNQNNFGAGTGGGGGSGSVR